MKGLKQLVQEYGIQLSAEQLEMLDKGIRENYATRAELDEKRTRIASLTEQVNALSEKVEGGAEATKAVEELKAQVEAFKKAEEARSKAEAENARRATFEQEFDEAVGGRRFVNEPTRRHILAEAFKLRESNPDMKIASVVEQVTSGDNIWENLQQQTDTAARPSDGNSQAATLDFVQRLFSR